MSCQGICGDSFLGMCWCDDKCTAYGDCCRDYERECVAPDQPCGTRGAEPCQEGSFCHFPEKHDCGRTDLGGTCQPFPTMCTEQYEPVCGCDGRTYANPCYAQASGISVDYKGECENEPVACGARLGDTCAKDEYCAYTPGKYCGAADATAVCQPRPDACTEQYEPVCGCDNKTYSNACKANLAGQGVLSKGACEAPAPKFKCLSADDCNEGEWCNAIPCLPCNAGPDKFCPAVCFGYCEALPEPKKLCMSDQHCAKGYECDASECLSGCPKKSDIFCPAVCFGQCKPAVTE